MAENREYFASPDGKGEINISEDVIAYLAASAAEGTDGVAGLSVPLGRDIGQLIGRKNISKGVCVTRTDAGLILDVYILVLPGKAIVSTAAAAQENIRSSVVSATGFETKAVNVHVCGIELNKEG